MNTIHSFVAIIFLRLFSGSELFPIYALYLVPKMPSSMALISGGGIRLEEEIGVTIGQAYEVPHELNGTVEAQGRLKDKPG